ncbi:MAG: GHMP kinase [Candidatus Marinimicrobia bacterium]|nr:GHMP kinase [Candidatus Neomarinimicrobiota bacterium]
MIGTRTPFRVSFIGGGSDLKEFYSRAPGCVLSTSIDKYMYIFVHPFFDEKIQVKYSKTELVENIEDIKHPIVREILSEFNLQGVDINSIADIPAGTGLGSSSSYTVGLLHALYAYRGEIVSPNTLAEKACYIEIDVLNEPIGKQDQFAAAYGGLNIIRFLEDGSVKIEPIKMEEDAYKQLQKCLMMFYTGTSRSASEVLIDQKKNIISDKDKFNAQLMMTQMVEESKDCLVKSNLDEFGEKLDSNWILKRTLSKTISNSIFDDIYNLAKESGAIGGKILGAGGGGFFLFYCPPRYQDKLRFNLKDLKEVPFKFDKYGSKIINMDK